MASCTKDLVASKIWPKVATASVSISNGVFLKWNLIVLFFSFLYPLFEVSFVLRTLVPIHSFLGRCLVLTLPTMSPKSCHLKARISSVCAFATRCWVGGRLSSRRFAKTMITPGYEVGGTFCDGWRSRAVPRVDVQDQTQFGQPHFFENQQV